MAGEKNKLNNSKAKKNKEVLKQELNVKPNKRSKDDYAGMSDGMVP